MKHFRVRHDIVIEVPFALYNDDTLLSIIFVVRSEEKKRAVLLPMTPFTLDDKKNNVLVVKCEWTLKELQQEGLIENGLERIRL